MRINTLPRLIASLLLFFAIVDAFRLGIADVLAQKNDKSNIVLAKAMVRENEQYWVQEANLTNAKDRLQSEMDLRRAMQLNPYDSDVLVRVAIQTEFNGNPNQAEQLFLKAAAIDKTFDPRWSLANFYYRQNEIDQFWSWARQALDIVPNDAAPLFRLCWRVSQDYSLIEQKLAINRAVVQENYLQFLMAQNDSDAVASAAMKLASWGRSQDTGALLGATDYLIGKRKLALAASLWDTLAEHRKIPLPAVQPPSGERVINNNFQYAPSSVGFDWRITSPTGIVSFVNNNPPGLMMQFNGDEPEETELLSQIVMLQPAQTYKLTVSYSTDDIDPNSGLRWQINDAQTNNELDFVSSVLKPSAATFCFANSADSGFARLVFLYHRPLGKTRISGSFLLRSVSIADSPCQS